MTLTVTTYVEVDEKYYCRKHGKEANEKALIDKQSEFEGGVCARIICSTSDKIDRILFWLGCVNQAPPTCTRRLARSTARPPPPPRRRFALDIAIGAPVHWRDRPSDVH